MTFINIPRLKDCDVWRQNPNVNPLTRRKIASGKRVYKLLDKECTRLQKRRSYRQSKASPVGGKISPRTQSPITSMDKALSQAISQHESIATACRANEKFDALTSRCIPTKAVAEAVELIEESRKNLQQLAEQCRKQGMKYDNQIKACVARGEKVPAALEGVPHLFGEAVAVAETTATKMKRLAAECRAKNMKYDSVLDKCVELQESAAEVAGVAQMFAESTAEKIKRLASECRARGMKYDAVTDKCIELTQTASALEGAAELFAESYVDRMKRLAAECRAQGMKYSSVEGKCVDLAKSVSEGEMLFGIGKRAESYPEKMKRLAAECRAQGMKYSSVEGKCVELKKAAAEMKIATEVMESTMPQPEVVKTLEAQGVPEEIRAVDTGMEKAETALEIIQGTAEPRLQVFGRQVEEPLYGAQAPSETREVLADVAETFESAADQLEKLKWACRAQGMAYSQSLEKCVAPPTVKGETKVERLRRLAAECRQKGLRYNATLDQCVALKKAAAKVETAVDELVETYVKRPDYFELMMEDDCEGYEYPSADFSKCYKFSDVKSTTCPSEEIFHYREMKCQPKSQAWSKGEHDIKFKYDEWLLNQKRFGAAAPKEEAPKFKNVYEALAARQNIESYPDKMKRLAAECRKEGKKYNAKQEKCVELSKSATQGEMFLGIGKHTMKAKDMGFDLLLQKHQGATTKEERAKWKNMLNAKCKELQGRRDSYYNFREDECEHK